MVQARVASMEAQAPFAFAPMLASTAPRMHACNVEEGEGRDLAHELSHLLLGDATFHLLHSARHAPLGSVHLHHPTPPAHLYHLYLL
jgi:hypothetical protein